MGFDVDKALRETQEAEKYLSAAEQLERRQKDFERALDPVRRVNEQFLDATRNLGGIATTERFLEQQRQQRLDLIRNLSGLDQYKRRVEQLMRSLLASSDAQVSGIARQVRETLAAHDAQVAEMSRRILEAVNAQMVSVRPPRMDVFLPTRDYMVARVPYHPPPAPEPVAEADVAPMPQPSAPARERDIAELIVIGVVVEVVSRLLIEAILWRAQTGVWVFEELLAYYIEQLK